MTHIDVPDHLAGPLLAVVTARLARLEWPDDDHPFADEMILDRLNDPPTVTWSHPVAVADRLAEEHEIPPARIARRNRRLRANRGHLAWPDVAVEALADALEVAVLRDPDRLRAEWVKLAAVALAAVEAIDRRQAGGPG